MISIVKWSIMNTSDDTKNIRTTISKCTIEIQTEEKNQIHTAIDLTSEEEEEEEKRN